MPVRCLLAARKTGLPLSLGCALLLQESGGGANVFGHDPTIFTGAGTVTKQKYLAYKAQRGHTKMQGVGPCQLTWWEFQDEADKRGGCWRPLVNMQVAFGHLAALVARSGLHDGVRAYNGSGPAASRVCMDKYATGERLRGLEADGITSSPKVKRDFDDVVRSAPAATWAQLTATLGPRIMVKPLADGCSAGVVPLASASELATYVGALAAGATRVDKDRFTALRGATAVRAGDSGDDVVELPPAVTSLVFEAFQESDDVVVVDSDGDAEPAHLQWSRERDTQWIEVTVGVLGRRGAMRALSPSLTIARKGVLSVEEKFMGGTGVNITPPPPPPLGRR
jgi:hypothetical protein